MVSSLTFPFVYTKTAFQVDKIFLPIRGNFDRSLRIKKYLSGIVLMDP